jgi:hypothetical protein
MLVNDTSCNIWNLEKHHRFELWTRVILFSKMLKFSQEKLQRTKFCEGKIWHLQKYPIYSNENSKNQAIIQQTCVEVWQGNVFRIVIGDKYFTETWTWQKNCHYGGLSWTRIARPWRIFVDSLLPKNPIVSCVVFTTMLETCVTPVKIVCCCWTIVNVSNVWDRIPGRIAIIPFPSHPTFVPSATFRTTGRRWVTSRCTKEGTVSIARVRSRANNTTFFFGPFGVVTHRTCARPCRIDEHHSRRRVGSMDGTEGLRPIHYQLHTVGECMHPNAGAGPQM